jgi:hypothetical protein
MRRVHGSPADRYRMGHGCLLEPPDNSSLKQPWLAAQAWVAWRVSPLLPAAQRQRHGARGYYDLHRQLRVALPLLLQQRTPIPDQTPPAALARAPSHPGQTKTPMVTTQVTPLRGQAFAGLMLFPTKTRGLLSGTMVRGTLTRGLNRPKNANTY